MAERVAVEQDDILITLQLVRGDQVLEDRLFHQLVDLLVEGLFLELRRSRDDGSTDRSTYLAELHALASNCRAVGLLPLAGRSV